MYKIENDSPDFYVIAFLVNAKATQKESAMQRILM